MGHRKGLQIFKDMSCLILRLTDWLIALISKDKTETKRVVIASLNNYCHWVALVLNGFSFPFQPTLQIYLVSSRVSHSRPSETLSYPLILSFCWGMETGTYCKRWIKNDTIIWTNDGSVNWRIYWWLGASNSSELAVELLQSCAKPSICITRPWWVNRRQIIVSI